MTTASRCAATLPRRTRTTKARASLNSSSDPNVAQVPAPNARKRRQNVILAVVHALLALAILAGFVYVQSQS